VGQWVQGGTCGDECEPESTPTATAAGTATNTPPPGETPTATATATKVPDGGDCDDPVDCESDNCVDDTCCADPSCPPGESCDNPGNQGMCSPDPAAPAPAISSGGKALATIVLIAIGAVALLRWRRPASS
jgi:hypothetical protein